MKTRIAWILPLLLLCHAVTAAAPLRVVSLAPALTELLFQLGAGEQLVGRSDACDFPEAVKRVPVAGRFAQPDCEAVLRLHPDVVIANDLVNPAQAGRLRACGITVKVRQCRTPEEYCRWAEELGTLLDRPAEAAAEIARVRREEAALSVLPPLGVSVLWVVWDRPLMAAAAGSLPDTALHLIGAVNRAGALTPEYCRIAPEALLREPPDWIIWSVPGQIPGTGFWAELRPVKEGRVLYLQNAAVERPGPRWLEGVRQLRKQWEEAMHHDETR